MEKVMIRKPTRRCATKVAAAQAAVAKAERHKGARKIRRTAASRRLHPMAISLLVTATVSLGFNAPAQADTATTAAQVNTLQTRGQTAYAQYVQYTDNYCEGLSVEVFAGADLWRTNQTRTGGRSIFVQTVAYNSCTGAISFMSGSSTDVRLKFAPDLSPIDASGTVTVSDGVDVKTINVALHWDGGNLTSTKTSTVNTSPSSTTSFHQMDSVRSGADVTGSIVVNGIELLSPANVVDFSTISGFAFNAKSSSIEIVRNL
jgi:hypothetical protein